MNGKLFGLFVLILSFGASNWYTHITTKTQCKLANAQAVNAAVTAVIEIERKQQRRVTDAITKQTTAIHIINNGLRADLDKLRKRPGRVSTTIYPRSTCQGTTGAELSREDSEFLSGEAARADTIRAALITCYEYADSLQHIN